MKTLLQKVYAGYLWLDDRNLIYPLEIAIIIGIFLAVSR